MSQFFADTFYWIALINPGDDWHQAARKYAKQHPNILIVTTDGVLDEVLNYASKRGTLIRQKALSLCARIIQEPRMLVVSYTPAIREQGLLLYEQRSDKQYSITDCISMVVMKRMNIRKVLTHDKHFNQKGFEVIFSG
ncbi:MAG: PIN domain-containing protein [Cyanobacteria bacterium J06621_11]